MKKSAAARSTRRVRVSATLAPIASEQLASVAGGRPDGGELKNMHRGLWFCYEIPEDYTYEDGRIAIRAGTVTCTPYPFDL